MINPTALTKNNFFLKKVFNDRLMIPFLGMNMGKSIIEATVYVMSNAYKFSHPLLMIHGLKDVVTNPNDTIKFFNKCGRYIFIFK